MRQLLGALEFLHDRDIVHRGVTREDILIQNDSPINIALTGFDFSQYEFSEKH